MDNGAGSYRRFLDGDDAGMVALIRDYKDGLILYLNGFVGNLFIAEELMEEVFFRLTVKKPRFSGKSSFKTWLYAIGRNVALDHLRRCRRKPEVTAEDTADEETLERTYIKEERRIAVHRALRQLKPEYRQILWLVYFEDFSNAEAAYVMKKNRHQIENLVYRARKALKTELEKEGFAYEKL